MNPICCQCSTRSMASVWQYDGWKSLWIFSCIGQCVSCPFQFISQQRIHFGSLTKPLNYFHLRASNLQQNTWYVSMCHPRKLSDQQSIFTSHYHSIHLFWPNHVEIPVPFTSHTVWNCSYQMFSLDLNHLMWDSTICEKVTHYLDFCVFFTQMRGLVVMKGSDLPGIEKVCTLTQLCSKTTVPNALGQECLTFLIPWIKMRFIYSWMKINVYCEKLTMKYNFFCFFLKTYH